MREGMIQPRKLSLGQWMLDQSHKNNRDRSKLSRSRKKKNPIRETKVIESYLLYVAHPRSWGLSGPDRQAPPTGRTPIHPQKWRKIYFSNLYSKLEGWWSMLGRVSEWWTTTTLNVAPLPCNSRGTQWWSDDPNRYYMHTTISCM